jgi:hypothetical protein
MNNRSLHSILEGLLLGDGSIASIQEVGMQIHEHPDMIAGSDNTIQFSRITPSIFIITPPRLST